MMRTLPISFALLSFLLPLTAPAQEEAPLQADIRVRVKSNKPSDTGSFRTRLDPGGAIVKGTVQNLPGGETALVQLEFDYKINADIALDEIISKIVISIEDAGGTEFSLVTIDPNTVNLNPNRVPLFYSATLYNLGRAASRQGYFVRIRVFGNYE